MASFEQFHEKLVAIPPRTLVARLASAWRGKSWATPRPLVTIVTADNVSLQGFVVAVQENGNERTLLFKPEAQHSPYRNELAYLSLDRVVGVVVHGAESYVDLLSEGAVAKPRATPAPSQLDLKRLAQATGEALKVTVMLGEGAEAIPAGEGARGNAADVLEALKIVFTKLRGDAEGKAALEGVHTVALAHGAGETARFLRSKETLRFVADFEAAFPEDLAAWLAVLAERAL